HMAGYRWWNPKHPAAYEFRVLDGLSSVVGDEVPDTDVSLLEKIMVGVRLAIELDIGSLVKISTEDAAQARIEDKLIVYQQLIEHAAIQQDKIMPTLRGRLLDDAITRRLAGF